MPIQIYNSLTQTKEPLVPLKPQEIKMYVCGPTVYDDPHIGHARSAYIFDVIRRYLIYKKYKVKFVRNVTDVDDKIIDKARNKYPEENLEVAVKKVAKEYLDSYHNALEKLGIRTMKSEVIEPKASEYIPKMVEFIEKLIEKKVAYTVGGDVYFDITKAKDYGKLSKQSLDKVEVSTRATSIENKKNPLDFALWKSAKPGEPSWPSPWGAGRPGWHIECSVMSSDILGGKFDIHGGGLDLIFPHHENEIAQSEGAGNEFAKYWIHHGLLTINGQKMAKSLGNFVTVEKFIKDHKKVDILKLFFLNALYSQSIDYNDKAIESERNALENRIETLDDEIMKLPPNMLADIIASKPSSRNFSEIDKIKTRFNEAMDDNFNMPGGRAAIFELIELASTKAKDNDFLYSATITLNELLYIFGLTEFGPRNQTELVGIQLPRLGINIRVEMPIIQNRLTEREEARKNRNYIRADQIREEVKKIGIILEDAKDGRTIHRMQWDKFAKYIEKELNKKPNDINLRIILSIIYGEYIGNKQKAIDLSKEILHNDENNISANFNLGVYTQHLSNYNESLSYFNKVEELIKENNLTNSELYGKLHIFIGHDYLKLDNKPEAERRYNQAITILKNLAEKGDKTSAFWLKDVENNLEKLKKIE